MVEAKQENLTIPFRYESEGFLRSEELVTNFLLVPDVPGLPDSRPPLIKLLQLVSYSLLLQDDKLSIYAFATIPSPFASVKLSVPQIPYEVHLLAPPLEPLPISSGIVAPTLTPPNISLPITGEITPLAEPESSAILSSFLSQFLSGIPPPISIRSPLIPNLTIETTFPPPDPLPQILENVTVKHMSMAVAPGGGWLASGEVWATIALPPGLHIPINVTHVWPDVLVFDGPVTPDPDELLDLHSTHRPKLPKIHLPNITIPHFPKPKFPHWPGIPGNFPWHHIPSNDDPPPLPDPVPEHAFARIRPTDWVVATTIESCDGHDAMDSNGWVLVNENYNDCAREPDGAGWKTTVMANVEKAPLQVLPGRDKQFRAFVSKAC